jgi:hypothetical protein
MALGTPRSVIHTLPSLSKYGFCPRGLAFATSALGMSYSTYIALPSAASSSGMSLSVASARFFEAGPKFAAR